MLSAPVPAWLGKISFSLYLVQAPVIATLAFGLGDRWWPLIAALGIPACLLAAWAFWAGVERPSHRLSRWVGRRVGGVRPASTAPDSATNDPARDVNAVHTGV
jgi:peptidoglycan/LPS O-acetylase OafA/YrhL